MTTLAGGGGCWRISGDNHWTTFEVNGGTLTFDDFNGKESFFETTCIDLSQCDGIPILNIDMSSNAGSADGDEYIDVYYNYNGGGDVLLYRKVDTDLQIWPSLTNFRDTLPIGTTGCVTITLKMLSDFNEEYKIDNIWIECIPKNNWTYTYLWCNGETTATATGLPPNSDCGVTVTDNNGCTAEDLVTCGGGCVMTVGSSQTNTTCNAGNDGSGTVTPSSGTPPYTYVWDDAASHSGTTATGLTPGTYNVTVNDNSGSCSQVVTVTITDPPPVTVVTDSTDALCNGDSDGTVVVTPGGGVAPFTYTWNTTATDSLVTGLTSGTYTVTVTDNDGCSTVTSVSVDEPTVLTSGYTSTDATCNAGSDGTGGVTPGGGSTPYGYNWNTGQTDPTSTGLTAGTYTITITDANGCTVTENLTVNEPTPITGNPSSTPSSCGNADGIGTVTPSGGNPGYTYVWDDASSHSGVTATGLSAGSYNVTITDVSGCTTVEIVNISDNAAPTATVSSTPSSCSDATDGGGVVTPSGGTPGYTYQWDPTVGGQTTGTVTGLSPGSYGVTVTDAGGCVTSLTLVITGPPSLTDFILTDSDAICNGGTDGSATISVSGGTPTYTYIWSDAAGHTTVTATGLSAGTYYVTATDANNCTILDSVLITEPLPVTLSLAADSVTCAAGSDGTGTVSPTGGTSPFTYIWSDGQTDSTATGLTSGTYSVTVTDASGCSNNTTVSVDEPPTFTVSSTQVNVLCYGDVNGSAGVTPTGGTSPYTYTWGSNTGSQTTQNVTGLGSGIYRVTVTDQNGCVVSPVTSIIITEPNPIWSGTDSLDALCGADTGSVWLTPFGGTPGYTYIWSNGATDSLVGGLTIGTYTVTITDQNGCTLTTSIGVGASPGISATITSIDLLCFGDADGSGTVTPISGASPFTYNWDNTETNTTISGLTQGNYSVTVADANGCDTVMSISITEPPQLLVDAGTDTTLCDPTIIVIGGNSTATGGTPTYNYVWSPSGSTSANPTITGITTGSHMVTVTDANGCVVTDFMNIVASGNPAADFSVGLTPTCDGVEASYTNLSTNGYTYEWTFNGTVVTDPNPTWNYNYGEVVTVTLVVTNTDGCTDTLVRTDTVNTFLDLNNPKVPNVFTPNSDGINDYFRLDVVGDLRECTEFKIFNRWGLLLYDAELGSLGWDGATVAGQHVPEGTYFYIITIKDEFKVNGWLSLIKGK